MKTFLQISLCVTCVYFHLATPTNAQQSLQDSLTKALLAADQGIDHRVALAQYCDNHPDGTTASVATGTVSKGTLVNGKLIPFRGDNFGYYDTLSFLDGRAFVHTKVKDIVLTTYEKMAILQPGRIFTIMECSKQNGGKIWPHRTHQNGMSIDFMVPMSIEGTPFYGLYSLGFSHYLLEFEANGTLESWPIAKIDLDVVAMHLLTLQTEATAAGLTITKVLLQHDLLQAMLASSYGPRLKAAKIYFPTGLEPLIDQLHDNHYHVDFGFK